MLMENRPSNTKKVRNAATEGWAAAQALKVGYAPLYTRNEYMHQLGDAQLRGLVVEETGVEQDSTIVKNVIGCIKQLKKFAKWDAAAVEEKVDRGPTDIVTHNSNSQAQVPPSQGLGLNLGYTINLNLPATSDPAVFNAIFRALKEHLLKTSND